MEKRRSPGVEMGWGEEFQQASAGGRGVEKRRPPGGRDGRAGGRGVEKRRSPGVEIADGWRREGRRGGRDRRHCDGDD